IPIGVFKIYKHLEGITCRFSGNGFLQGRKDVLGTEKKIEGFLLGHPLFKYLSTLAVIYMQLVGYRYHFILCYRHFSSVNCWDGSMATPRFILALKLRRTLQMMAFSNR